MLYTSLELSQGDSSNDGSQHKFKLLFYFYFKRGNMENYLLIIRFTPSYPEHWFTFSFEKLVAKQSGICPFTLKREAKQLNQKFLSIFGVNSFM